MKKQKNEQEVIIELITLNEVCELLRLSQSAVRNKERRGEIPSYRFGKRKMVFKKHEVLNLLKPKNH